MATLEMVDKLKDRAQVSYEEAKEALDASGDDLLEALIYLEKQGKTAPPENGGYYNSKGSASAAAALNPAGAGPDGRKKDGFGQALGRFFCWCGRLVQKSCANIFEVWRQENSVVSMPVLFLILALIFFFWVSVPLLVIGLFCGCRYRFRGKDVEKFGVNHVMDAAADAADNFKQEIVHPNQQQK
ncbi:MAG: ubiquitin [Peptococcaceae bacterium]|nr:ubiquitin [Peptococcaceae bacterium]